MFSRRRTIAASAALLLPIGAISVARRSLRTYRVNGESMRPTLESGDVVVAIRLDQGPLASVTSFEVGDVVIVRPPWEPGRIQLKRVVAGPDQEWADGDERVAAGPGWVLVGDQRVLSTDSRHHGRVPTAAIEAVALLRSHPPGRRGGIPDAPTSSGETSESGASGQTL